MSSNIYALLIGINNYNGYPLEGCLNDVTAVEGMLQDMYATVGNLHIKKLTDKETACLPTRDNIVAAFDFFEQAVDGDTCLFYFCGHGANISAPPVLAGDEGTNAVQVIVCMDWQAGVQGKGYIIDKELSFLIWKATYGKPGVNFIAITDCCHSGTNTRAMSDEWEVTPRQMEIMEPGPAIDTYLGFDFEINGEPAYVTEKDEAGALVKVSVKGGPHIHLAAAMDTEVANELKVNGTDRRGALSYVLVDLIRKSAGAISYRQVAEFATIKLKNLYFNASRPAQNPKLNVLNLQAQYANRAFLSAEVLDTAKSYSVYYDKAFGWCLAAGILTGISAGDTVVVCATADQLVQCVIQRAALLYSVLAFDAGVDTTSTMPQNQRFKGFITGILKKALPVGFDASMTEADRQYILDEQYNAPGLVKATVAFPGIRLITGDSAEAQYTIAANYSSGITKACLKKATGEIVLPDGPLVSPAFLPGIDAVARWQNTVALKNPDAILDGDDYTIDFTYATGFGDSGYTFVAGDISKENTLQYFNYQGEIKNPAFRFSITNTGSSSLFLSFAYLDADYGIQTTGTAFEDMQVEPGLRQFLLFGDYKSKNFLLANEDEQNITEYLKIFISPVNVIPLYSLEQFAPVNESTRSVASSSPTENWQVITLKFVILPKP